MAFTNLPPIDLDSSSTYQYMVYDPTTRRAAISETTKYSGTGTFIVADDIPYRDAVNTLRQPQTYTPVWFGNADYTTADVSSIVVGDRGGSAVTTGANSVAITPGGGGPMGQAESAIAIGNGAGRTNQGSQCVAIGLNAGQAGQLVDSIAIGTEAGMTNQESYCIAIGGNAGAINQQIYAIAIGSGETYGAGYENQGTAAISIGSIAGRTNQGADCIAIGVSAGQGGQLPYSIAIGSRAGLSNQQGYCIAIGFTDSRNQQKHAIAIGNGEEYVAYSSGGVNQGAGSIAIGAGAGAGDEGSGEDAYSICIGYLAGTRKYDFRTRVAADAIFIDATGPDGYYNGFVPTIPETCSIRPIRNLANIDPSLRMHYDPVSFELSWGVEASSARFKTNVTNLSENYISATLNDLKPVEFDFIDTGRQSIGFIAEDVHRVLPDIVVHNPLTGAVDGIEYDKLVAPLVRLAQNQQYALDRLQMSYETLQTSYEALQTSHKTLQASCEFMRSECEANRTAAETLRLELDKLNFFVKPLIKRELI